MHGVNLQKALNFHFVKRERNGICLFKGRNLLLGVDVALMEVEESETKKGLCARNIVFTLYVQVVGPTAVTVGSAEFCTWQRTCAEKASCTCVAPYQTCIEEVITKLLCYLIFFIAELCSHLKIKYFASEYRFCTGHKCGLTIALQRHTSNMARKARNARQWGCTRALVEGNTNIHLLLYPGIGL